MSKHNSPSKPLPEISKSAEAGSHNQLDSSKLAEEALSALRQPPANTVRVAGQKHFGDIDIPSLSINAMGLAAISSSELYLYSGSNTKRLSLSDLTKTDADGSQFVGLWDGKRSAEVHWGDRPDQRYLLYPTTNKTWKGESDTPNEGAPSTVVQHIRLIDGAAQLRFNDGRCLQIANKPDRKEVHATGHRQSENFFLYLQEKENHAIGRTADGKSFQKFHFDPTESIVKAREHLLAELRSRATDEHSLYKLQADMMYLETIRIKQMESNFTKSGMNSKTARRTAEKEIEQTYECAARIAEYRSFIRDKEERDVLPPARLAAACAEQIVAQASHPTEIDQGRHPSCAAASLEVRAFSRYPGRAARFISDLAFTAHFNGKLRGSSVDLDLESLKAHQDARVLVPHDEERGIASQIFQVGTYNLMYAMNDRNLSFKQEEISKDAARGDRLYDKKHRYDNFPVNKDNWLMDAYEEIVGVKEGAWMLSQPWFQSIEGNSRTLVARTEAELLKILQDADKKGNFPLSITVDTRNDSLPRNSSQRDGNAKGGRHAINAYGLIAGPVPKVEFDNEWGADDDRLGKSALGIDQLFDMMNDPTAFKIVMPWQKAKKKSW